MVDIEELKKQWPTMTVAPYGECVVVPGREFDPDWEVSLGDEGHKCFNIDLDHRQVTLVQLEKKADQTDGLVFSPERARSVVKRGRGSFLKAGGKLVPWKPEEDDLLLKEWPRAHGHVEEKARALAEMWPTKLFPKRSAKAIEIRYRKLLRKARQESKGGKKRERKPREKTSEKSETCPDCGLPTDLCCCDEEKKEQRRSCKVAIKQPQSSDKVVSQPEPTEEKVSLKGSPPPPIEDPILKLLEEIRDVLIPGQYHFEYHCRSCGDSGTADDSKVWQFCPKCGEDLIILGVEEVSKSA